MVPQLRIEGRRDESPGRKGSLMMARLPEWSTGYRQSGPNSWSVFGGADAQLLALIEKSGNTLSMKRPGPAMTPEDIACISKDSKTICPAS
jgi:hypothetical protein